MLIVALAEPITIETARNLSFGNFVKCVSRIITGRAMLLRTCKISQYGNSDVNSGGCMDAYGWTYNFSFRALNDELKPSNSFMSFVQSFSPRATHQMPFWRRSCLLAGVEESWKSLLSV